MSVERCSHASVWLRIAELLFLLLLGPQLLQQLFGSLHLRLAQCAGVLFRRRVAGLFAGGLGNRLLRLSDSMNFLFSGLLIRM